MTAYAYPVTVEYKRKTIREERETRVEGQMVASELLKITKDAPFSVISDDNWGEEEYVLYWYEEREETDGEMQARIAKGEAYNAKRKELIAQGKIKP